MQVRSNLEIVTCFICWSENASSQSKMTKLSSNVNISSYNVGCCDHLLTTVLDCCLFTTGHMSTKKSNSINILVTDGNGYKWWWHDDDKQMTPLLLAIFLRGYKIDYHQTWRIMILLFWSPARGTYHGYHSNICMTNYNIYSVREMWLFPRAGVFWFTKWCRERWLCGYPLCAVVTRWWWRAAIGAGASQVASTWFGRERAAWVGL